MSVAKFLKYLQFRYSFFYICGLIILSSLYLRSIFDIGPDTAVFLDVGKKISMGKKYFYDIFEINFPLNMWNYALQYRIAKFLNIHPIIFSEIIVNILSILSIVFLAKKLPKFTFFQDKIFYYLFIIFFLLAIFLRPFGLRLFEFGTKTSYFLILFFPYFYYYLKNPSQLTRKENFYKGFLMALIFALKPHYAIFIIILELYSSFYYKYWLNIFSFDKLIAVMVSLLYLLAIHYFYPEFFGDVLPMWSEYFNIYSGKLHFIQNVLSNFAFMIVPYSFVYLIYSRFAMQKIDHKLLAVFIASSLLVLVENVFTIDQFSLFCSINMGLIARILIIIFSNNFLKFKENLFFLGFFLIMPFSQNDFIRLVIFGYSGIFNMWWLMVPYLFYVSAKKIKISDQKILFNRQKIFLLIFVYLIILMIALFVNKLNYWFSNLISVLAMFGFLFIYEKYYQTKINEKFSTFSVFFIMSSIFMFSSNFIDNFNELLDKNNNMRMHQKIYDYKFYYHKKYLTNDSDKEINFYDVHHLAQPFLTYLQKDFNQKMSIYNIDSTISYLRIMMPVLKADKNFSFDYFLQDLKKNLFNQKTKLIFVDQLKINLSRQNICAIGYLEYLFYDKEIKDYFLKNYRFENRIILTNNYQIKDDFISNIFNKIDHKKDKYFIKGKFQKITSDIEVYVRKN